MYTGLALTAALFLAQLSVPAGAPIAAKLESTVKTATSHVGDQVVASLTKSVSLAGVIVVPEGSLLRGRVETIQQATRNRDGRVRLLFREIEFPNGQRIQAWITHSFAAEAPNRNARYIVYTALGATAGGWIGGKTARVAGILGGTIVGFVIAGSRNAPQLQDLTLRPGQQITLELGEDLVISSAR